MATVTIILNNGQEATSDSQGFFRCIDGNILACAYCGSLIPEEVYFYRTHRRVCKTLFPPLELKEKK